MDTIAARLPEGAVKLGARVSGLARDETKQSWIVTTNKEEKIEAQGKIEGLRGLSEKMRRLSR